MNNNINFKIIIALTVTLLISIATFYAPISFGEQTPTIWTDKSDYKPEETVTIYGLGFLGEATIYLTVTRPDNVKDSWTVISSNNGSFVAEYCLDGITGSYLVEATDGVSSASTIFTDTADWTTELLGWDMVSKTWVSGNLAGYSEGDLVGFKFIITNNQNVPSVPPQVNSFYDYFSVGNNAVGIDAEILWQYNYGKRSEIDFSTRFPPTSYMSILPNIENQFYKYQGGVRQNYYQFDAGRFPALKPKESLIIYFQAHLAETAYWKTVLDAIDPDLSPNKPDPVPGPHYGASYFPGASLQVGLALVYTGTKTETQSIPVSYAPGAISGYKFNDLNGDGIWDAGEPGLANWTIILDGYDAVGHHIVSQINTTSSGSYAFTGLPLGTYNITEILKAGWMQTHPSTGFHYNVTITEENRVITGKNFGNLQPGKTSGFKFNDLNGDGIWDAGEPALQGWNITLTGAANKWTLTDASGYYEFADLLPGTYTVSEELQTGWVQTAPASGAYSVNIDSGSIVQDLNFGNFKLVNITVFKYEDITGDGYSLGDVPLSGWDITLYKDGLPVSTMQTGTLGNYTWTNLGPGSYAVKENIPAGWINTSATSYDLGIIQSGGDYSLTFTNFKTVNITVCKLEDITGNGSSADDLPVAGWTVYLYKDGNLFDAKTTNSSGCYSWNDLGPGSYSVEELMQIGWINTSATSYAVGVVQSGSVYDITFTNFKLGVKGGFKYEDGAGSGPSADDTPLQGWTIELYKWNGTAFEQIGSTLTGIDGYYEFADLTAGLYRVYESLQASWTMTYPVEGYYEFNVTSGFSERDNSFYNFNNVNITVCKVNDIDGNLATTEDQMPLADWELELFMNGLSISNVTTASNGCYMWIDLGPGNYSVIEKVPTGWISLDASTRHNFGFVTSGEEYTWTFHNFQLGTISGYKFNDLNGDGIWDAGEPALQGWNITLTGAANKWTLTDASGYYEFADLLPGTYTVSEELQTGWVQTYPSAPGTYSITITSGANLTDANFGNKEVVRFLKEFTGAGALNGYTPPSIVDPITAKLFYIKTGPSVWFQVTYTVVNKDNEGHYYMLWDKWGANLLVLNATPTAFNPISKVLTLNGGTSFKIDYAGYSTYLGSGLVLSPSQGTAIATLHIGDQQQGTNPGKGKGTTNDGKAYDVSIRWEIGWLNPGESATLVVYVAPGMNPGGQLEFSSWGTYVINTGPRVRAYSGPFYNNNEFLYSWSFTNQLTVLVQKAI